MAVLNSDRAARERAGYRALAVVFACVAQLAKTLVTAWVVPGGSGLGTRVWLSPASLPSPFAPCRPISNASGGQTRPGSAAKDPTSRTEQEGNLK